MPQIISCECGVRVRVPEGNPDAVLRCPKCKATLNADEPVPATPATGLGVTCPICSTEITDADAVNKCPSCEQAHHGECWDEVGGCSTYGCEHAPEQEKGSEGRRALTAWGDTKECPRCGEEIKSIALRCRYCGAKFETVDPLSRREYRQGVRDRKDAQSMKTWVILCLALTPCLAPITMIVAAAVFLPKRNLIAKAGPIYPVLAYASVVLGGVICLVGALALALGG